MKQAVVKKLGMDEWLMDFVVLLYLKKKIPITEKNITSIGKKSLKWRKNINWIKRFCKVLHMDFLGLYLLLADQWP